MKLTEKNKKYLMYHFRWQAGIIFSWPVLYFLQQVLNFGYFLTIISFSFLGALFFWPIDNWILNKKKKKEAVKVPRNSKVEYLMPRNEKLLTKNNNYKINRPVLYNRTQNK